MPTLPSRSPVTEPPAAEPAEALGHELQERIRPDEAPDLTALGRARRRARDVGEGEVVLAVAVSHPGDDRVARLDGDRADIADEVVLAHVGSTIIRLE